MVVGIDVHKRAHVAALLDERGGELATLGFANSPAGMQKLLDWLVAHGAGEAVVGGESPAGFRPPPVPPPEAAGAAGLNRPPLRPHPGRRPQRPRKTPPPRARAGPPGVAPQPPARPA